MDTCDGFLMKEIRVFENFGISSGGQVYATRAQILELYKVPKNTLAGNIERLKKDNLINGTKIRSVAQDGKLREIEVYTLEESIAIGFRLRSDTAIELQRYATRLIIDKMKGLEESKRLLELELSHFWNKSDIQDLYG